MFIHRNKQRTIHHNRKLASLLSFVAGMVNVAGFFAVGHLTTNVTGHVAFFSDVLSQEKYGYATIYLAFILAFLLGAFFSSLYMEAISDRFPRYRYFMPVSLEIIIITIVSLLPQPIVKQFPVEVACALLFSMGMQNALVTTISNSIVRTTHLTGLFTDLGIELSQLFFYKTKRNIKKLSSIIKLRIIIIVSFFTGGLLGGLGYQYFNLRILLLASSVLLFGLVYDAIKFKLTILNRRYIRKRR